jgi:hypothetical protein
MGHPVIAGYGCMGHPPSQLLLVMAVWATRQRAEQSRFLGLRRGVIKLPLQQRQVAIRVTRFQRFFLLAACFLMVPAPVTFSNFAATRAG